ncbi:MAG TPA: DUF11 domain-containing protein, partial [Anaerolineae bacterium]|nr:DUF11 domain-containing protein [Anaerolineae bacterium]
ACLTYQSATPAPSGAGGGVVLWDNVGPLPQGNATSVDVTFTVAGPCAAAVNTARVEGATDENGDPVPTDTDDETVVTEAEPPDAALTKTLIAPSGGIASIGDVLTYTVVVANTGPNALTRLVLTDTYNSACLTFAGAQVKTHTNPQEVVAPTGQSAGQVVWNPIIPAQPPLLSGQHLTLTLTFTATDAAASCDNSAAASGVDRYDQPLAPTSDNATVEIRELEADLALDLNVNDLTPDVGSVVTFTLVITNSGPFATSGVTVAFDLPSGYTFGGVVGGSGYNSGTGVWTIGDLPVGAPVTLIVTATVLPTGVYPVTAEVGASALSDPDSTPGNGSITEDDDDQLAMTPNPINDLAVAKSVNDTTPDVGDVITFTVIVTNHGPSAATGVVVNDLLPSGYTYQAHTASAGTYTPGSGVWSVGNLAANASATLRIRVQVNPTGAYANTATVDGNEDDPTPGNNRDTETPILSTMADLAVAKSVNDTTPAVGDVITFTVVVTNHGPSAATGVVVTDALPSGYTYQAHTPSGAAYTPATGVWAVGSLADDASATLQIRVQVNATGEYTNTATVGGNEDDPTPGNDRDTETPILSTMADLAVAKSVNDTTPAVGDV